MSDIEAMPVTEESLTYDFWFDEDGTPYLIENPQHTHDIDLSWDPSKTQYCDAPASPDPSNIYWNVVRCYPIGVEKYIDSPFSFLRRLAERVVKH